MANAGGDCSVNGSVVEQQTRVVVAPPTTNDPTEDRALRLAVSTYRLTDESTPADRAALSSPFASSPPRPRSGPGPVGAETTPELPKTSSSVAAESTAATEKWSDTSTAQVYVCVYGTGICLCLRRVSV